MHPVAYGVAMEGVKIITSAVVQGRNQKHAHLTAQLHASTVKDLVDAVTTRRLEIVEKQCQTILIMYAEQARNYMKAMTTYDKRRLRSRDALERAELAERTREIDCKLAEIRADAKLLYGHMGELLLAIGGRDNSFSDDITAPLALAQQSNPE